MALICPLVPRDRSAHWVEELPLDVRSEPGTGARDPSWTAGDADKIEQAMLRWAERDDDTGRALKALSKRPERHWYKFMEWLTGRDYAEAQTDDVAGETAKRRVQKMMEGTYGLRGPYRTKKKKDELRKQQGVQ